jgi:hypothetical protein
MESFTYSIFCSVGPGLLLRRLPMRVAGMQDIQQYLATLCKHGNLGSKSSVDLMHLSFPTIEEAINTVVVSVSHTFSLFLLNCLFGLAFCCIHISTAPHVFISSVSDYATRFTYII